LFRLDTTARAIAVSEAISKVQSKLRLSGRGSSIASLTPNRHSPVDIDDWLRNERYPNEFVLAQDQSPIDDL
jgi:hypothetical protein